MFPALEILALTPIQTQTTLEVCVLEILREKPPLRLAQAKSIDDTRVVGGAAEKNGSFIFFGVVLDILHI